MHDTKGIAMLYDKYAALCRKCTDRNAVHDLFNALARRSLKDGLEWRRLDAMARLAASQIIAGAY